LNRANAHGVALILRCRREVRVLDVDGKWAVCSSHDSRYRGQPGHWAADVKERCGDRQLTGLDRLTFAHDMSRRIECDLDLEELCTVV
jgi:hypothetical protein